MIPVRDGDETHPTAVWVPVKKVQSAPSKVLTAHAHAHAQVRETGEPSPSKVLTVLKVLTVQ